MQTGIHFDVPVSEYFSDCAPSPSLNQSTAKVLIERSPLHAWYQHCRLNPDYKSDNDTKFDVGNIAHSLMLGRGKDIVALEFKDWRTNAAKDKRDEMATQGKLGVLGKDYARASKMVKAAREQLELRDLDWMFNAEYGHSEVVAVWQEDGIYLRQMIDFLTNDNKIFVDLKTTDMSVAPHGIDRMMVTANWSIQAAMAERGLDVLDPANAGRRKFYFVVQETELPYQLSVVQLTRGPLTMGHKMLDRAVTLWRECMATNQWPGYPLDIVHPEFPGWAEQQWLTREITDAARERKPRESIPSDILMAG